MFIPCALHGIEASFLADTGLRRLRTAIFRAVWSGRHPLAHTGAVVSLLAGPSGCNPVFCVVWFWFRVLRWYHLAYRPGEIHGVHRLIDSAADGCPGHGPAHFLERVLLRLCFSGIPVSLGGSCLVCMFLAGPIQHFRAAVLEDWRNKVSAVLCAREGFRGGLFFWITMAHCSSIINSGHVWERDKALLRGVLGGVWNGFLFGKVRGQHVPCRSCGGADNDGHLFWDCPFPPLVEIREHPEFYGLLEMDESCWPGCLLWHGWLLLLVLLGPKTLPWAEDPADGAGNLLECALGPYTSDLLGDWRLPVGFDAEGPAGRVAAEPDVWTDGSLVEDKVSGIGRTGHLCADRRCGHLDDDVGSDRTIRFCRVHCSWTFTDCSEG